MTNKRKRQDTPSVICRASQGLRVYVFKSVGNSLEKGCPGTVVLGNVLIPGRIAQVFWWTEV